VLDIAQPALSQALTRMEKKLGVMLSNRTRRGADLAMGMARTIATAFAIAF